MGRPPLTQLGPPSSGLRPQAAGAAQRPIAAASAWGGPIGADGRRPLLSSTWAGVAARKPSVQPQATPAGPALAGSAADVPRTRPAVDEDGFTLVKGGNSSNRCATSAAPLVTGGASTQPAAGDGNTACAEDDAIMDDPAEATHGGGAERDEELVEPEADGGSAEALKEQWHLDQRLLKWVKAQGLPEDHPTRVQAERQVEASHQAWLDAKPRTAYSRRMRGAEQALERARKSLARMEQSIGELDTWYEAGRASR